MAHRYDGLAKPEGRTRIEVVANPVQLARSIYRIWQPIAERSGFKIADASLLYDGRLCERLYQDAVARLQPSAEAFAEVGRKDLAAIVEAVPSHDDCSGLFLSALLNATRLPQLDSVLIYKLLGYRLAHGKTLILREGSETIHAGMHACGWLINKGNAHYLAHDAAGGLQANEGTVKGSFADCATGGIQVNFRSVRQMAEGVRGGVQANYGTVRNSLAEQACGGLQVNDGDVGDLFGAFCDGGTRLSRTGSTQYRRLFDERDEPSRASPLLDRLARKLQRAIPARTPEEWRALERDIHSLARQLRRAAR